MKTVAIVSTRHVAAEFEQPLEQCGLHSTWFPTIRRFAEHVGTTGAPDVIFVQGDLGGLPPDELCARTRAQGYHSRIVLIVDAPTLTPDQIACSGSDSMIILPVTAADIAACLSDLDDAPRGGHESSTARLQSLCRAAMAALLRRPRADEEPSLGDPWRSLPAARSGGLLNLGIDGMVLSASDAEGRPADHLRGRRLTEIAVADEGGDLDELIESVVSSGDPCELTIRAHLFAPGVTWYSAELTPVVRQGETIRLLLFVIDAPDKKTAQVALAEMRQRQRMLLSELPVVLLELSLGSDGFCSAPAVYITENVKQVTGFVNADFARPGFWFSRLHTEDRTALAGWRANGDDSLQREYRWRCADGTYRWFYAQFRILLKGEEMRAFGTWVDISERKSLQAQLFQSQKMEAVGRLAGGIAHDFSNLLTIILSFAGFVRDGLNPSDPRYDDLSEVLQAGERAAGLTGQLLAFSRRQHVQPRAVEINAAIGSLRRMLQRTLGECIELTTDLQQNAGAALIDPIQLDQVLVNLAVNASDAMPDGGHLMVRTRLVALDASRALAEGVRPGHYVAIEVQDTGCGMPEEVLQRAFEPFFTTKERGRGTGLGLATCYGIVQQAGGNIRVESILDEGTSVRVLLPSGKVGNTADKEAPRADKTSKIATDQTILVVEDETSLRRLAVRVLEGGGYRVLGAANGVEAMSIFQSHPDTIALIFADVIMPKMGGFELASCVTKDNPGVRVLFTSGYGDAALAAYHGEWTEHPTPLLRKPYSPATVLRRVREMLSAPPSARALG